MIIETRSAQETFQLGKELGEKAYPGQVFTLTGDLVLGKLCLRRALRPVLELQSRLIVRHLRSYRCMRKQTAVLSF